MKLTPIIISDHICHGVLTTIYQAAAMMAALLYFSSSASSSRVLIVDYGECPIPVTKSTMGKSHRGKDHRIINTGSLNRWCEMQEPYWLYSLVISHYAKHFIEQKSHIIRGPIILVSAGYGSL